MAFKIEFYDINDNCDKCSKSPTNIHLEIKSRDYDLRQKMSFCFDCWTKLEAKVAKNWKPREVPMPELTKFEGSAS